MLNITLNKLIDRELDIADFEFEHGTVESIAEYKNNTTEDIEYYQEKLERLKIKYKQLAEVSESKFQNLYILRLRHIKKQIIDIENLIKALKAGLTHLGELEFKRYTESSRQIHSEEEFDNSEMGL